MELVSFASALGWMLRRKQGQWPHLALSFSTGPYNPCDQSDQPQMSAEASADNLPKMVLGQADFVWPATLEQTATNWRLIGNWRRCRGTACKQTDIHLFLISAYAALGVAWTFLSCLRGEDAAGPHRDTNQPHQHQQTTYVDVFGLSRENPKSASFKVMVDRQSGNWVIRFMFQLTGVVIRERCGGKPPGFQNQSKP